MKFVSNPLLNAILLNSALALVPLSAQSAPAISRATSTGAIYTQVLDHPELGQAWRDSSGLIWGDTALNSDGSFRWMSLDEASSYCASIGARLPTYDDWVRLRDDMGGQNGTYQGYFPQVLPNLGNSWFWAPLADGTPGVIVGGVGVMFARGKYYDVSVRCVSTATSGGEF